MGQVGYREEKQRQKEKGRQIEGGVVCGRVRMRDRGRESKRGVLCGRVRMRYRDRERE